MHHSYVRGEGAIKKIHQYLVLAKKEPNRSRFQFPSFLVEADVPIEVWKRSRDIDQIIFGRLLDAERFILRSN